MIAIAPSSAAWVARALGDVPTLLLDHAHCEKKAAATALRLVSREPALGERLSRLAREELVHFERVLGELRARGLAFRALPSGGYAAALLDAARDLVDELLCCALIEARSHERFARLRAAAGDERLRRLYAELEEAEARHGALYLDLACERASDVEARLGRLSAHEAEVIARPGQPLRMHSG